eukprot:4866795-Pleurochrysis_carterae.AAC.1
MSQFYYAASYMISIQIETRRTGMWPNIVRISYHSSEVVLRRRSYRRKHRAETQTALFSTTTTTKSESHGPIVGM